MVYEDCRIWGPYKRTSDGRYMLCIRFPGKKRTTVSYPKYLMEKYLDRYLLKNETVDHIDGNFNNNDLSNLQVLDRKVHCFKDAKRYTVQEFKCPWCKKYFLLYRNQLAWALGNKKRGKCGPFCSKKCSGKYGKFVQNGGTKFTIENNILGPVAERNTPRT